ncbi:MULTISPECIES: peroxiredoxin-like family protein [Mycobacteriaceae]|uniref:AhpC/TSA antioxidant enzyme n=1 Tax=Mycobacteroides salmoniphilum TaxID=404941 RepID=A0A4R8SDM3_9MYCO|nr:peroxiredoxin-like family protein [Mycobacteroides salmoniphilum]MBA0048551.1 AhpC/TSA family protein [Mycobacteroides sp. LB1]TDZ93516.1 hypothetical protein CCUG60885_03119 [Mycobacteroides salmoniphilum]TEA09299.1 hypothetical protein CCUG60883_00060 [Mycobacteroides salmoniphilum]
MTRVDVIANERLLDDRHHWHELQEYWTERPVALVFLQQFGSATAQKQAKSLTARQAEIDAVGAVVLIGLGTPIQGFAFRKNTGAQFPILTTADQTLYRTMGLWRSRIGTLGPANLPHLLRLAREGTYPIQSTGDIAQLGGAFVIPAGGGSVSWDFRAHRARDIAPVGEIIDSLTHAANLLPKM